METGVMLPKKRKVNRETFASILKKGRSFHSKNISIRVYSSKNKEEDSRFSFVVSKKISNNANKRNLLKRRGYDVVKGVIKNIKKGFIGIFFYKKGILDLSYLEIRDEIVFLLKKSDALK